MSASSLHLSFTHLADLAEERIIADPVTAAHLAVCPRCSADLAWLRQTLSYLRATDLETPPPATTNRLKAMFRQRRPVRGVVVIGSLQFDSTRHAPAFGMRSGGALERQMIVHFAALTVDLRISQAADGWQVMGQLLSEEPDAALQGRAELLGLNGSATAAVDDLGEFALASVRSGEYRLTLLLDTQALVIPQLDLGM